MFLPWLLIAVCADGPSDTAIGYPNAGSCVRQAEGFVIESHVGQRVADNLATACLGWRRALTRTWLGREPARWSIPCRVVVHASEADYVRAVGGLGVPTGGSSLVKNVGPRITARRIDLNGGRLPQALSALPHELTHIILADQFAEQPLPRWAEEGVALTSDTLEKRSRHRRDLEQALGGNTWMPLRELLQLNDYPRREQVAIFYAQSASLVEFLTSEKSPAEFVSFLKSAQTAGPDRALEEHYQISVAELERRWLRYAMAGRLVNPLQLVARPGRLDSTEIAAD